MSENNHEELFKTTLMGGFDKDDVMTKVQNLKDQAYAAQKKLEAKIEENEQEIEKLNRKIREREDKIEELEKNIHEKYQSYIDNYDSISGLVFEAQVKAKKLTQETEESCLPRENRRDRCSVQKADGGNGGELQKAKRRDRGSLPPENRRNGRVLPRENRRNG